MTNPHASSTKTVRLFSINCFCSRSEVGKSAASIFDRVAGSYPDTQTDNSKLLIPPLGDQVSLGWPRR
jgi:hypothetical protein